MTSEERALLRLFGRSPGFFVEFVFEGGLELIESRELRSASETVLGLLRDGREAGLWSAALYLRSPDFAAEAFCVLASPCGGSVREAADDVIGALQIRWCLRRRQELVRGDAPDADLEELETMLDRIRTSRRQAVRPSCGAGENLEGRPLLRLDGQAAFGAATVAKLQQWCGDNRASRPADVAAVEGLSGIEGEPEPAEDPRIAVAAIVAHIVRYGRPWPRRWTV